MPALYLSTFSRVFQHLPFTLFDVVLVLALVVFLWQERYFDSIHSALTLLKVFIVFLGSLAIYPFLANVGLHSGLYKGTSDALCLIFLAVILLIILQIFIPRFVIENDESKSLTRFLPYLTGTLTFCISAMWMIALLLAFPLSSRLRQVITNSSFSSLSQSTMTLLDIHLQQILGNSNPLTVNAALVTSQTSQSYNLHYQTSTLTERDKDAQQLILGINKIRQDKSLATLYQDSDLVEISTTQAREVAKSGNLSSLSSQHYALYDRLAIADINYTAASEIIINATSLSTAMIALQNNPDAQQILLDSAYSAVGVGAVDTGSYGEVFVIDFLKQ